MSSVPLQKKVDALPIEKRGEQGSRDDLLVLSPCDDPRPRVSPSGVGDNKSIESIGAGRGMGPSKGRGSMNGTPVDKQSCGDTSFPARPRSRAPKPCPVCKRLLVIPPAETCSVRCSRIHSRGFGVKRVTRKCRNCGADILIYANDVRARRVSVYCSRECRSEHDRKYGRSKIPSKPAADIKDVWVYGNALADWRAANGMTVNNLSSLSGVPSGSIQRVERGEHGLSQYYYERLGKLTGVW